MDHLRYITSLLLVCLLVIPAMGFTSTIDGNLSDWDLSKLITDPWSVNETWLPMSGISFVIEDNKDPRWGTPSGVHIIGSGSSYSPYLEPKVITKKSGLLPEPIGGEPFDLEAFWLGEDTNNVYVAVVTSVDPSLSGQYLPGDLAINLNMVSGEEFGYEWGIVLGKHGVYPQGTIVYLPDWEGSGDVIPPNADIIIGILPGGSTGGPIPIAYNNTWMTVVDNGKPNWAIELCIPKADIGMVGSPNLKQFRLSENCINDTIIVPEFPTLAVLISMVLGMLFLISHIKSKR